VYGVLEFRKTAMMTGASNGKEEVPLLKGKSFNPVP